MELAIIVDTLSKSCNYLFYIIIFSGGDARIFGATEKDIKLIPEFGRDL